MRGGGRGGGGSSSSGRAPVERRAERTERVQGGGIHVRRTPRALVRKRRGAGWRGVKRRGAGGLLVFVVTRLGTHEGADVGM